MMNKSLVAMAVLGAFAGSAFAATVTLDGNVDAGFNYQYQKIDGQASTHQFTQYSGGYGANKIKLTGSEDLGNGLTAGFRLENGFAIDAGTLGQGGRLFGRQATAFLRGDFGEIAAGRMGALSSGSGGYTMTYDYGLAFGSGWSDTLGNSSLFFLGDRGRMDNTFVYVTPQFGGLKLSAQYSFKTAGQEDAQESKNKRYIGLGALYQAGPLTATLVVDTIKNDSTASNTEDAFGVSFDTSYDLGVAKISAMAVYGQNENMLAGYSYAGIYGKDDDKVTKNEGLKGYGLGLGVTAPVTGGTVYAQVNYTSAESEVDVDSTSYEMDRWGLAAAYVYKLSKRTSLYVLGGYNEGKLETKVDTTKSVKTKTAEFGFGVSHAF